MDLSYAEVTVSFCFLRAGVTFSGLYRQPSIKSLTFLLLNFCVVPIVTLGVSCRERICGG